MFFDDRTDNEYFIRKLKYLFDSHETNKSKDIEICDYLTTDEFINTNTLISLFYNINAHMHGITNNFKGHGEEPVKRGLMNINNKRTDYTRHSLISFEFIKFDDLIDVIYRSFRISFKTPFNNDIKKWHVLFYILYNMKLFNIFLINKREYVNTKPYFYYTFIILNESKYDDLFTMYKTFMNEGKYYHFYKKDIDLFNNKSIDREELFENLKT